MRQLAVAPLPSIHTTFWTTDSCRFSAAPAHLPPALLEGGPISHTKLLSNTFESPSPRPKFACFAMCCLVMPRYADGCDGRRPRPNGGSSAKVNSSLPLAHFASRFHRIMPSIAESIAALEPLPLLEIGTQRWLVQARAWAALAAASSAAAARNTPDVALDALLRANARGLPLAVASLLNAEAWRVHVLPRMARRITCSARSSAILVYHVLQHEAALASMLELALYDEAAARALADEGDAVLDLLDYCVRAISRATLARARGCGNSACAAAAVFAKVDAENIAEAAHSGDEETQETASSSLPSAAAQLAVWCRDIDFNLACSAVTTLRFLTEHAHALPLAVLARMLDRHDLPTAMVPLIENPPWVRRLPAPAPALDSFSTTAQPTAASAASQSRLPQAPAPAQEQSPTPASWQKCVGRAWIDVNPRELLRLTPLEGQPWLTLLNLLLEPDARRRYALHSQRCAALQRARRFLTDELIDQVPPLARLRRYLDEAALLAPTTPAAAICAPTILLEPVVSGVHDVERDACAHAAELDRGGGDEDPWDVVARVVACNLFDEVGGDKARMPEALVRELLDGSRADERKLEQIIAVRSRKSNLSPRATIAELAASYCGDDDEDKDERENCTDSAETDTGTRKWINEFLA